MATGSLDSKQVLKLTKVVETFEAKSLKLLPLQVQCAKGFLISCRQKLKADTQDFRPICPALIKVFGWVTDLVCITRKQQKQGTLPIDNPTFHEIIFLTIDILKDIPNAGTHEEILLLLSASKSFDLAVSKLLFKATKDLISPSLASVALKCISTIISLGVTFQNIHQVRVSPVLINIFNRHQALFQAFVEVVFQSNDSAAISFSVALWLETFRAASSIKGQEHVKKVVYSAGVFLSSLKISELSMHLLPSPDTCSDAINESSNFFVKYFCFSAFSIILTETNRSVGNKPNYLVEFLKGCPSKNMSCTLAIFIVQVLLSKGKTLSFESSSGSSRKRKFESIREADIIRKQRLAILLSCLSLGSFLAELQSGKHLQLLLSVLFNAEMYDENNDEQFANVQKLQKSVIIQFQGEQLLLTLVLLCKLDSRVLQDQAVLEIMLLNSMSAPVSNADEALSFLVLHYFRVRQINALLQTILLVSKSIKQATSFLYTPNLKNIFREGFASLDRSSYNPIFDLLAENLKHSSNIENSVSSILLAYFLHSIIIPSSLENGFELKLLELQSFLGNTFNKEVLFLRRQVLLSLFMLYRSLKFNDLIHEKMKKVLKCEFNFIKVIQKNKSNIGECHEEVMTYMCELFSIASVLKYKKSALNHLFELCNSTLVSSNEKSEAFLQDETFISAYFKNIGLKKSNDASKFFKCTTFYESPKIKDLIISSFKNDPCRVVRLVTNAPIGYLLPEDIGVIIDIVLLKLKEKSVSTDTVYALLESLEIILSKSIPSLGLNQVTIGFVSSLLKNLSNISLAVSQEIYERSPIVVTQFLMTCFRITALVPLSFKEYFTHISLGNGLPKCLSVLSTFEALSFLKENPEMKDSGIEQLLRQQISDLMKESEYVLAASSLVLEYCSLFDKDDFVDINSNKQTLSKPFEKLCDSLDNSIKSNTTAVLECKLTTLSIIFFLNSAEAVNIEKLLLLVLKLHERKQEYSKLLRQVVLSRHKQSWFLHIRKYLFNAIHAHKPVEFLMLVATESFQVLTTAKPVERKENLLIKPVKEDTSIHKVFVELCCLVVAKSTDNANRYLLGLSLGKQLVMSKESRNMFIGGEWSITQLLSTVRHSLSKMITSPRGAIVLASVADLLFYVVKKFARSFPKLLPVFISVFSPIKSAALKQMYYFRGYEEETVFTLRQLNASIIELKKWSHEAIKGIVPLLLTEHITVLSEIQDIQGDVLVSVPQKREIAMSGTVLMEMCNEEILQSIHVVLTTEEKRDFLKQLHSQHEKRAFLGTT